MCIIKIIALWLRLNYPSYLSHKDQRYVLIGVLWVNLIDVELWAITAAIVWWDINACEWDFLNCYEWFGSVWVGGAWWGGLGEWDLLYGGGWGEGKYWYIGNGIC